MGLEREKNKRELSLSEAISILNNPRSSLGERARVLEWIIRQQDIPAEVKVKAEAQLNQVIETALNESEASLSSVIVSTQISRKIEETKSNNAPYASEVATNLLKEPRFIITDKGTIAYGTDEGFNYKARNEDAVVVHTPTYSFACIDGMGGMRSGKEAAEILAGTLLSAFKADIDFEQMATVQTEASRAMAKAGIYEGGACYIAAKIVEKPFSMHELQIAQAGDVKLVVFDSGGKIKFETQDEGRGHIVYNAVTGERPGSTTLGKVFLDKGDRIIVSSDGIWDQMPPEEVAETMQGSLTGSSFVRIVLETEARMKNSGRGDNRSLIIFDFNPASLKF